MSTFEITANVDGLGPVLQSGKWFSGVDRDDDDNVFYYFGVGLQINTGNMNSFPPFIHSLMSATLKPLRTHNMSFP